MMKRLFTLCLALTSTAVSALADTYYGIKVAGVKVTSANYKHVENDISGIKGYSSNSNANLGDPSISYAPDKKTLTIWNVKLSTSGKQAIYNESCDGLTIVFKGGNSINTSGNQTIRIDKNTTIQSLEWTDGIDNKTTAIACTGTSSAHDAIRLFNGITLTISDAYLDISSKRSCFDVEGADPTLQIVRSTVKATCNARSSGDDYGIKNCKLLVRNSTVTLTGYSDKAVSGIVSYTTARGMEDLAPNVGNGSATFNSSNKTFYDSNGKLAKTVRIQPMLEINSTNFPDAKFRSYLLSQSYGSDSYLSEKEVKGLTSLDVSYKGISDLKGIEYLTALTYLYCYGNSLNTLDLYRNTALTLLQCYNNNLSSLNVSNNKKLTELTCYSNKLTSLNVDNNTELTTLKCQYNSLTALSVAKNTKLKELYCQGNNIQSTNMDRLVNYLPRTYGTLYVCDADAKPDNIITTKQVAAAENNSWRVEKKNGSYWESYAGFDPIAINTTNFPDGNFRSYLLGQEYGKDNILNEEEIQNVLEINVSNMGIKSLVGIEFFTELASLTCDNNELTKLNLSNNKKLMSVKCSYNKLDELALSCQSTLKVLECYNNKLSSLDIANYTALQELHCFKNSIWNLDVNSSTALTVLSCGNNNLRELIISRLLKLKELYCSSNYISKLNIGNNKALERLDCSGNNMEQLVVTSNQKLAILECYDNKLNVLDVSQNKELQSLYCYNNSLTVLDLSYNVNLTALYCYGNKIDLTGMDKLVNSLSMRPSYSNGVLRVNKVGSIKDNVISTSQVAVAKEKRWIVSRVKSDGTSWEHYDGIMAYALNETNFPDEKFRTIIHNDYNTNWDAYLTEKELGIVTTLNLDDMGITDLKGIEYFTELTSLNCSKNSLSSLDVSNNKKLITLICYGNQIRGTEMDNLVNGLPTVTEGKFVVCDDFGYSPDINKHNIITADQVNIAKGKGWKVKKIGSNYKDVDYAGQGDVNGDNKIDQNDLELIVKIIMGQKPAGVGGFAGDLNNDGKTDAADIVLMNNILNGFNAQQQIDNVQEQNSNNKLQ